eukprot:s5641_g1.t1
MDLDLIFLLLLLLGLLRLLLLLLLLLEAPEKMPNVALWILFAAAGRKGAAQGQGTQPTVTVATAKSRAERSLVIQVAHPEADEPEAAETPG